MNFTPTEHVVCVIRERIGDILLGEGYGEDSRLYADKLAVAYWKHSALDEILKDLRFILDNEDFDGILGFCKLHYPILFATIPSEVRSAAMGSITDNAGNTAAPHTQHDTTVCAGMLDSAASRTDSFRAVWPDNSE